MTDHSCDAYAAVVTPGEPDRVCLRCTRTWVSAAAAIRRYRQMADDARAARVARDLLTEDDYQDTR